MVKPEDLYERRREKRYQDALLALNQRRFPDAERQFRRFLKDYPSHVGALNLLTIVLMSMERFGDAEPVHRAGGEAQPIRTCLFYAVPG